MKKQMLKRILITLLCVGLLSSFMALTVSAAASGSCGTNVTWALDDAGTLTISGTGAMTDFEPFYSQPWYPYADSIKKVVIENGVTSIGTFAFYDYGNLREVVIPDSVTVIRENSFAMCRYLRNVTLSKNLKVLEMNAFYGCDYLRSIVIPASVTSIGQAAFGYCAGPLTVKFEGDAPAIHADAFWSGKATINYNSSASGWTSLVNNQYNGTLKWYSLPMSGTCNYDLSWSLTTDGVLTISGSKSMADFYAYNSTIIETRFLAPWYFQAGLIHEVIIEEGVTSIGNYAFQGCNALRSVSVPTSVKDIGQYAFSGCSALQDVYYEGSGKQWSGITIDSGNSYLNQATVQYAKPCGSDHSFDGGECIYCGLPGGSVGENVYWTLADGALNIYGDGAMYEFDNSNIPWIDSNSQIVTVNVQEGVTTLSPFAFSGCSNLTTVSLPATLVSLGDYAFRDCKLLTEIVLPANLETIGNSAFHNCEGLTALTIPSKVTEIGSPMAESSENLTVITFTGNMPTIGDNAFRTGSGSLTVYYPGVNTTWETSRMKNYGFAGGTVQWTPVYQTLASGSCGTNVKWTLDERGVLTISGSGAMSNYSISSSAPWTGYESRITAIVVEDGVTTVGDRAFRNFQKCTSVRLPATLTYVGAGSFYGMDHLPSITIPSGITAIQDGTFSGCDALTEVHIPEGITYLGWNSFSYCEGMKRVYIPTSVTGIESEAFSGCYVLEDVFYAGTAADWSKISIGNYNEPLTDAAIHCKEVTGTCGTDATWTLYSDGLLVVSGSDAMTSYKNGSASPFDDYTTEITRVIISEGITKIGNYAFFYEYPNLEYVQIPASVTIIGKLAFGARYDNIKLKYVGTMEQWRQIYISDLASYSIQYGAECTDGTIVYKGDCGSGVEYELQGDGTLKVTGSGTMSFYQYLNYESHWSDDKKITRAEIEEGVSNIAGYAFKNCTNLKTIHIPISVKSVSYNAFENCTSLTDVYYAGNEKMWNAMNISTDTNDALLNATIHFTDLCADGHTWTEATCTAAKTCSVCDKTEGTPLDHTYDKEVAQEQYLAAAANCIAPATYYYSCECGAPSESETFSYGGLGDHDRDENHKCAICGNIGGECGQQVTWVFDEATKTLTVSGTGAMADYNQGETPWYGYRANIQHLTVGEGVTTVGENAFADLESLLDATLPDTLKSIGAWGFSTCKKIRSLEIPAGVTSIGAAAFDHWYSSIQITIPAGVTEIPSSLFYCSTGLQSVTMLGNVTKIDDYAFTGCDSLKNVNIPDSVTYIGKRAFYQTGLTSVTIPEGVTALYERAFYNCRYLTEVNLPSGLSVIGDEVFLDCVRLPSIDIPNSVTTIGKSAFSRCELLEEIEIPAGVTIINDNTFGECESLNRVVIHGKVKSIGNYAFTNCAITAIDFPETLTKIGKYAFLDCANLTDVYFRGNMPAFGDNALKNVTATVHYPRTGTGWTEDAMPDYGESIIWQMYCIDSIHAFDQEVAEEAYFASEATCTAPATYYYSCRCGEQGGETFSYGVPKEHPYSTVVTAPTCTEAGYTTYTCHCGDTYVSDEVDALGHDMGDWTVTDEATCTEEGSKRSDCSRCDHYETEVIPSNGHSHEAVVTAPTCTEAGYTTYTCHCGDTYTSDEVAALGHDMGDWTVTDEATCTEEGSKRSDCSRCDHYETEVIPSNGHSHEAVVTAPTCTEAGYTTYTCHCGDTYISDEVAALGHTYQDGICINCEDEDPDYEKTVVAIITQPKTTYTQMGSVAKVSVEAEGDGLTYQWYIRKASGKTYSKSSITGPTYSVTMSDSVKDRRAYCIITDKYGNSVQTETVLLRMAATITAQPVDAYAAEGEIAEIKVAAVGDGLTYKWYYKNAGASKFSLTKTFDGPVYTAEMNEDRDGRQVYCVVKDKYGKTVQSNTVTLNMSKPLTITTQPKTTYTQNGATAKVTVKAEGDGLTYQWYIRNANASTYSKSSITGATYSVKMSSSVKDRRVYCIVKDQYGNTVQTKTVLLRMAASITSQPVNASAAKGKTVSVTVGAAGDGLTYTWYIKNASGTKFSVSSVTGATYSCTMSATSNGRQIYCVVTDKYGNTVKSNVVTLSMK